jgi:UDP-N-acetylglucosamine 3-dehydrogenase
VDGLVSKELAIGVVGLGFGVNHARVLSELPGVRLAAVCDKDESRLKEVAKSRDATPYSDFAAMLRDEKLDAVVVAVPARLHEELAVAAIEQGCAVLVEKPLARSPVEGQRIIAAASSANVPLMTGHIERFNPALRELARRVQGGEAGRVRHVWARRMAPIRQRQWDVNVVYDSAIHDIDAMRYVLGMEVDRVFAAAQSGVYFPFEDSISAVLQFAPDDPYLAAIGSLEVNWFSPRRVRDLTVLGDKGLFTLDYAAQTLSFQARQDEREGPRVGWSTTPLGEAETSIPIEPKEPLVEEIAAFVDAVRNGTDMPVSPADALAALTVAEAVTESARKGVLVSLRGEGND